MSYSTSLVQYALTGTDRVLAHTVNVNRKYRGSYCSAVKMEERRERRISNIKQCMSKGLVNTLLLKEKSNFKLLKARVGCNSRICKNCVEYKKRYYRHAMHRIVQNYKYPRFLTVGFKNVKNLTRDYLKECSYNFNIFNKYLKRRGYTLNKYVNVMEIKYNKDTGFNVHYHIIFDSGIDGFIPQTEAVESLRKATKGKSYYVDIRLIAKGNLVRHKAKAVNYITKYVTKMVIDIDSTNKEIEYYRATDRIRFVKIIGDKIKEKKASSYELLSQYMLNNLTIDTFDRQYIDVQYSILMSKYGMRCYDLEKDFYYNFFEYAHPDMVEAEQEQKLNGVGF